MSDFKRYTFFLFLFAAFSVQAQITYVDQDANGSNNGTSWANAYSSLNTALLNTTTGQLWVAEGTYIPAGGDSSATFLIQGDIELYGGFDGSEGDLNDRDYENNLTILSGDVFGDDVQSEFDMNKTDNVQHVLVVDSLIGFPVVIDGFKIYGGHTSDISDQSEFFFRGGGIFAYSSVAVSNCDFENNFGRSGAGVYVSPNAGGGNGSFFENCNFSYNYSTSQSAGIYLNSLSDIVVDNCTFSNNSTTRGAFYPAYCDNVSLNNCVFENNATAAFADFGGAIFIWQSTNFTISNTDFINNVAGNGGVIYHDGRETTADASNLVLDNCTFNGNTAQDWGGGAIYAWRSSMSVVDCAFNQNSAVNSGGHIFFGGTVKEVLIGNTTFENGSAQFGGAHNCYGDTATYTMTNNTYRGNIASTSGGAVINGFKANATYTSCLFEENEASFGGVMYNQNDTTFLTVNDCEFKGNVATDGSGGIHIAGGPSALISDSYFEANIGGDGGALFAAEGDAFEETTLDLINCEFNFNQASFQGGGISLSDVDVNMVNCLVINNASPDGAGGGLLNNVTDENSSEVNMLNCTFGNNASPIGGNIAQWTSDINSSTTMTLQNCLLASILGDSYEVEGGTPTLLSAGGNVVDDETAEAFLTQPSDVNNAGDPLFVDPFAFDFHLMAGSPAIDAGVDGAPEFDLDGNPRIDAPDAGAYEYQGVDDIEVINMDETALSLYPNPVYQTAIVDLENDWRGIINWQIIDITGIVLQSGKWQKGLEKMLETLSLKDFPSGNYVLMLEYEGMVVSRKVVSDSVS